MIRRAALAIVVAAVTLVVAAAPASADPPAPTDYRSEIERVEPPVDGVELGIVGGDSFIEAVVDRGVEVVVLGYRGEPYLWFSADGVVHENQRSPSVALNRDRFGTADISDADANAEPEWQVVARNGRYAWHDHRTHWMQRDAPLGKERGDQILEGVVPLRVDGTDVAVHVTSTWMPAPSRTGVVLGAAVGLVLAALVVSRRGGLAPLLGAGAAGALVIGAWQVRSVPAETGPSPLAWVLPLVALVCAAAAVLLRRRGPTNLVRALVALSAVELAAWAWLRRDVVSHAVLPTDAPWQLDRGVTVACALVAVAALVALGRDLLASPGGDDLVGEHWQQVPR